MPAVAGFDSGNAPEALEHVIAFDVGSVVAGDLLFLFAGIDGVTTFDQPSGWTTTGVLAQGTNHTGALITKVATGGETGVTLANLSQSKDLSWIAIRVTGAASFSHAITSGAASLNPDPPSHSVGWTAETLWLAAIVCDNLSTGVSAYPTDYAEVIAPQASGGTGGTMVAVGQRLLDTVTEDPGTYTTTISEQWVGFTVGIEPSAEGGGVSVLLLGGL